MAGLFLWLCLAATQLAAEEPAKITILQTTDLHGYILQNEESPGVLKLASVIRREYVPGKTLLIDCGDSFEGSFEAAQTRGEIMLPVFNALPYDAWVPGNHDFDWGCEQFLRLAKGLKPVRLAANLEIGGRRPEGFKGWALIEKAGLKVAVIGMTSPYLAKWLWGAHFAGLQAKPLLPSLDAIMEEVLQAKPDIIALALHAGEFTPERLEAEASLWRLAKRYPQIDLFLGGHTHQENPGEKLGPASWFVQSGQHAAGIVKVEIEYDKAQRKKLSLKSKIVRVEGEGADPELSGLLKGRLDEISSAGLEPAGSTKRKLSPLKPAERGNALSELLCRALAEASGARIAFHGTLGGASAGPGEITEMDLFRLVPYENRIATLELSREECLEIMDELERAAKQGRPTQAWGLERVRLPGTDKDSLKFADGTIWEGPERAKAAFNGYDLASGGGRLPRLAEIAARKESKASDAGIDTRDALRALLKKDASGRR